MRDRYAIERHTHGPPSEGFLGGQMVDDYNENLVGKDAEGVSSWEREVRLERLVRLGPCPWRSSSALRGLEGITGQRRLLRIDYQPLFKSVITQQWIN